MDKIESILVGLLLVIIVGAIIYGAYSVTMVAQLETRKAYEFAAQQKSEIYQLQCLMDEKVKHPSSPENITKDYCDLVVIGKLLSDLR